MRKIFCCILLIIGTYAVTAQTVYTRSDSVRVISLLREAPKKQTTGQRMIFFARKLLGLPYVGKTLEKNKEERLVVNLCQLDCTTFVESVLALTRTVNQGRNDFRTYCDQLRRVRYKDGKVAYVNRLHYFAYWISCHEQDGIVRSIQSPNPPFKAVAQKKVNFMSTHQSLYPMLVSHPQWLTAIKQMEQATSGLRMRYIPKAAVTNTKLLRSAVHDGDIIATVSTKSGLDTNHVGIAVWHDDGLHMINASLIYKRVVEDKQPLSRYLAAQRSVSGIFVARPL